MERGVFIPQFAGATNDPFNRLYPVLMAECSRLAPLGGPASVSIHNDRDMGRDPFGSRENPGFQVVELVGHSAVKVVGCDAGRKRKCGKRLSVDGQAVEARLKTVAGRIEQAILGRDLPDRIRKDKSILNHESK